MTVIIKKGSAIKKIINSNCNCNEMVNAGSPVAEIDYVPEIYEEHFAQIKSQSLHEKLAEIDNNYSTIDLFQSVEHTMAVDLENRILLGAILNRLTESEHYTLAKFAEYCLNGTDMSQRDAQDHMKTSEFILASNVPMDELHQLRWAHCRILAGHIQPSELQSWIEIASFSMPKELEAYFNQNKSHDLDKFIEWSFSKCE